MTVHDLPTINATLNGLSAIFLVAGFIFIKRGNQVAHRNCMIFAFVTSVVFLGGYLTYHATVKTVTYFVEPAWFRPRYLTVLGTHTFLATVIVPLILVALIYRSQKIVSLRKKIAFSIALLACVLFSIGLLAGFIFGSPRSANPHLNMGDIISGTLVALAVVFGFSSLLLFKFESHKAIARWTWPLWLYVSITGVVIYLLLYQIFPQK